MLTHESPPLHRLEQFARRRTDHASVQRWPVAEALRSYKNELVDAGRRSIHPEKWLLSTFW